MFKYKYKDVVDVLVLSDKHHLSDYLEQEIEPFLSKIKTGTIDKITNHYNKTYYQINYPLRPHFIKYLLLKKNDAYKVGDRIVFVLDKVTVTDHELLFFFSQSKPDPKTFFEDLFYLLTKQHCTVKYRAVNDFTVILYDENLKTNEAKEGMKALSQLLKEKIKMTKVKTCTAQ